MGRSRKKEEAKTRESMRLSLKRMIAQMRESLALAAEALEASYLEDEFDLDCLERRWSHELRDVQSSVKELVQRSHGWPGAGRLYFFHLPEDIQERLGSTLPEYPDRHFDDHRSELFCLAFHRDLPALHTDEWATWKENGAEIVATCPGYRQALEARIAEAYENAAEIERDYGVAVEVGLFGDLTIPREIDPWPEIQVGTIDDLHYVVTQRVTYGYHPDDRRPHVEGFDADEGADRISFMRAGRSGASETKWCLRTIYTKEYRAPNIGERIPLGQIPCGHWYRKREGSLAMLCDGSARDRNQIVIYIGEKPDQQIDLFGDVDAEQPSAFTPRSRRARPITIPGLPVQA